MAAAKLGWIVAADHSMVLVRQGNSRTVAVGRILLMEMIERTESMGWMLVFGGWLIATFSTLGALFFGEVMGLPPCMLCWYQRLCMFPLVLILPAGLFPFDGKIVRYTLPLAILGWLFGVFHLLLIYGFLPEEVRPCTQGVPCTQISVEWFGFMTIPLLSVLAFSIIIALLLGTHFKGAK